MGEGERQIKSPTEIIHAANLLLLSLLALLLIRKRFTGEAWSATVRLRIPNLIQACVQGSIYLYMSRFTDHVGNFAPLIAYQLFFAFTLDLLVSLFLHRNIRLGFSVLPIVLSINLFIWFKPAYFHAQLFMVTLGVLCKHLIVRSVGGQPTHVFNPSGIAMFIGSVMALAMGPHRYLQLDEIIHSYTSSRPYIFLVILFMGSVSQWVGNVALISMGAVLALFSATQASLALSGLPATNQWIDPAVFVGVTLLITDPMTSPRRNLSKFLFGVAYGLGIMISYGILSYFQLPGYFAKILPVPVLNILAPWFDRIRPVFGLPGAAKFARPWLLGLVHVLIFISLLPYLPSRRQSLLGSLGGVEWSKKMRR